MQCSWNIFKVKENSRYMMCSFDGSVRGAHHISVIFFYLKNIAGSLYVSNDLASLASVGSFRSLDIRMRSSHSLSDLECDVAFVSSLIFLSIGGPKKILSTWASGTIPSNSLGYNGLNCNSYFLFSFFSL